MEDEMLNKKALTNGENPVAWQKFNCNKQYEPGSPKARSKKHSNPDNKSQSSSSDRFRMRVAKIAQSSSDSKSWKSNKGISKFETATSSENSNKIIIAKRPEPAINPKNISVHSSPVIDSRKFSSRNSLRQSSTQPAIGDPSNSHCSSLRLDLEGTKRIMLDYSLDFVKKCHLNQYGLEEASRYSRITVDVFTRRVGTYYYCLLCGQRGRVVGNMTCEDHVETELHVREFWKLKNLIAEELPSPTSVNMLSLSSLVQTWIYKHSLTNSMIEERNETIREFYTLLRSINQDCHCRVIGSFATGTSLPSSDINLELIHPNSKIFESDPRAKNSIHHKLTDPDAEYGHQFNNHTLHYDLIANALDTLYKIRGVIEGHYTPINSFDVINDISDLNSKLPKLRLRHKYNNLQLEICCYAESSHVMTNLLNTYLNLDERAKMLSILVKFWAKQCRISSPPGTYPPETFVILVIHFLQRLDPPILPCLHDIFNKSNDRDTDTRSQPPQQGVSDEFVNQFERLLLDEKPEASEADTQKEPDKSRQGQPKNQIESSTNDRAEDEVEDEDEESQSNDFDPDSVNALNWSSSNESQIHTLFIQFMQFMMKEFSDCSTVISIRTLKPVKVHTKRWHTQVKAIENPLKPNINLSRVIGSPRIFSYIRDCFIYAYFYLTSIPLDRDGKALCEFKDDPREHINLFVNDEHLNFYFNMKLDTMKKSGNSFHKEMIQQSLFARDVEVIEELIVKLLIVNQNPSVLPNFLGNLYNIKMLIPPDISATKFCWLCKSSGHLREFCPKAKLQKINPQDIADSKLDKIVNLDPFFLEMFNKDVITPTISAFHETILEDLTKIIRSKTNLKCVLTLFGSTVNNLGSYDSDLDICMTLEGNPTGNGINCVQTLKSVCDIIESLDEVQDFEPILTARVPILKFRYRGYDIDLSMYNQCAIHNSRLLKTYSQIDSRLAQLFYLVKRYAKSCGIADASRGSLSSYAWSLMVIHFLQQTNPPILPVLQERKKNKPKIGVNGWNVWFDDDIESLNMTPHNKMNLTQLFKSFFEYYYNFNFSLYVVSIRTKGHITRFLKNWTNCMIAIEDPFELTYNLSNRLDDLMATYILNSFGGAYNNIVKFQRDALAWKNLITTGKVASIFDSYKITGQKSPPYRGCRHCHRVGHRVSDCPEKRKRDIRNVDNRRTKIMARLNKAGGLHDNVQGNRF